MFELSLVMRSRQAQVFQKIFSQHRKYLDAARQYFQEKDQPLQITNGEDAKEEKEEVRSRNEEEQKEEAKSEEQKSERTSKLEEVTKKQKALVKLKET